MHMQVGATLKPQKTIRRRSEITSLQFHTCLKVEKIFIPLPWWLIGLNSVRTVQVGLEQGHR
jgi:hypothetical protein